MLLDKLKIVSTACLSSCSTMVSYFWSTESC